MKKGISTGLGTGTIAFLFFFVHAVGYWFGGYLIQYHDATMGDVITVSHCTCIIVVAMCVIVGVRNIATGCIFFWPSYS